MSTNETTRRAFLTTVAAGALLPVSAAARSMTSPTPVTTATLLACGWDQLMTLDLRFDSDKVVLVQRTNWEAAASQGLPPEMAPKFRTIDDCKPIDDRTRVLVTSSSDGVAIIERATGKTEFYATVDNAHSAEALPGNRVVVASSDPGDRLVVFDRAKNNVEVFSTPLDSAHGTHWVESERTLWALGMNELQAYELVDWGGVTPSLKLRQAYKLPSRSGHDLTPIPGTSKFHVTTGLQVLIFDRNTGEFTPHPEIGTLRSVKSVTVHPTTGRTAYTQGDMPEWWTFSLRFLAPAATLTFRSDVEHDRLYKVRWLA